MNEGQKNYNVCFTVFSTLMGLALIVATQLPFKYSSNAPKDPASIPLNNLNPSAPQVVLLSSFHNDDSSEFDYL